MRKNLLHFIIALAVTGLAFSVFTVFFEIVKDDKYYLPSGEALSNDYLALDRWLVSRGHEIRVAPYGDLESIKAAREGTVLIQQELFYWNDEAVEYLETWVEKGGVLILCLDYYRDWDTDEEPGAFLNRLGLEPGEEDEDTQFVFNSASPSFGRNIFFKEPEVQNTLVLKDENDFVRLVEFQRGEGKIIVTGYPRFMTSFHLGEEENARLSWHLLAGTGDQNAREGGIFFIRGEKKVEGAVGRLFREGNFAVVIISAVVLIAAGFWFFIPVFGIVKGGEEKNGKALAERFLAEGRFLSRFGALDVYRAAYFRELRRRIMKSCGVTDEKIIPAAASLWASGSAGISEAEKALSPDRQKRKDFLRSVIILKTILERL